MKIFVTGDCHGDFKKFSNTNFPQGKNLTKEDYIIICGDFGGIWSVKNTREEEFWLNWLNGKPWTTLFIDGNHENFDRLNSYPVKPWKGGYIHPIKPSIFHLMRGNIFGLNGYKFLTFGGASSHDIQDGILDRASFETEAAFHYTIKKYQKQNKNFRINHISWWCKEVPSELEFYTAICNLDLCGRKVDYILTHEAPITIVNQLGYEITKTNEYITDILNYTEYTHHYFGHHHINYNFNKSTGLYQDIRQII